MVPSPTRIGEWQVRPETHEIVRGATRVRLEPKAMAVLMALARRPGEVVTKDDLLRDAWPGTQFESGVFRLVSELRRARSTTRGWPRPAGIRYCRGSSMSMPNPDDMHSSPGHAAVPWLATRL